MNLHQLLEQFLNISMQQHVIKDQTIEGLQKRVAELEKQLADSKGPTVLQTAN